MIDCIQLSHKNQSGSSTPIENAADSKLAARGILESARQMKWIAARNSWEYLVLDTAGQVIAKRLKKYDSSAVPKYLWLDDTKANYYHIGAGLLPAIAAAGGALVIANGEPAVLACHAAGLKNVISFFGENRIPKDTLIDDLKTWGVKIVYYYPDKDRAGRTAAVSLRDLLMDSDIYFDCRALPDALADGSDLNDLWELVGFEPPAFQATLESLPAQILPEPEPKRTKIDYSAAGNTGDLPEALIADIIKSLLPGGQQPNLKDGWLGQFQCPIGHHEHDHRNPAAAWNIKKHILYCQKCGKYYLAKDTAEALGLDVSSYYPKRTPASLPIAKPVATLHPFADVIGAARYVSELSIPDCDVLLISDTGTGKTTWAKGQGIDTNITHREALSTSLAETLDMDNYKGLTPVQLNQVNRLTICANSIHKIAQRSVDTLFLDEIRQALAHLGGDTFSGAESERAFNILIALIQRARRVIGADAYADETTVRFLKTYRPDLKVVVNTRPRERAALTLWTHKSGLIGKLWQLADENAGCVVVPTGSAALAKDLEAQAIERYGAENVMALYQEVSSEPERRAFLKQLSRKNAQINYRVFIYSPTVGSGIDAQIPVRATVGFFMAEPLPATDCHQMLNRFRQTGETHVYVQRKDGNRETNPDVIYENAVQNAIATGQIANFDEHGLTVVTDKQRELHRLVSEIEAADNASKNRLFEHFTELAKGYSQITTCDVKDEAALTLTREQRDARKKEDKEHILTAVAISPNEFRALVEAGCNTPEHAYGVQRYLIEKASGQGITSPNYDLLHTHQGRAALYLLTDHIHGRLEALAQADRDESAAPPLKRHHYSRRKILLDDLVKRVFGRDGLKAGDELAAQHIQEVVGDFIRVSGDEFRKLFNRRSDLSTDPRRFLAWLLHRLGLKLERIRRERDENGKRPYVYRVEPESLATMLELADSCYARQCQDTEARLNEVSQNVYQGDTRIHDLGQKRRWATPRQLNPIQISAQGESAPPFIPIPPDPEFAKLDF